jgi:hypothetical protein
MSLLLLLTLLSLVLADDLETECKFTSKAGVKYDLTPLKSTKNFEFKSTTGGFTWYLNFCQNTVGNPYVC